MVVTLRWSLWSAAHRSTMTAQLSNISTNNGRNPIKMNVHDNRASGDLATPRSIARSPHEIAKVEMATPRIPRISNHTRKLKRARKKKLPEIRNHIAIMGSLRKSLSIFIAAPPYKGSITSKSACRLRPRLQIPKRGLRHGESFDYLAMSPGV